MTQTPLLRSSRSVVASMHDPVLHPALQRAEVPPEQLPVPPTPTPPPGQRPPIEIEPDGPPEVGDPVLPGENAPIGDPRPPLTIHALTHGPG